MLQESGKWPHSTSTGMAVTLEEEAADVIWLQGNDGSEQGRKREAQ